MGAKIINISDMVKKLDNPPNRIREQRVKRGITLRQVAERLGTSQTQISRFETGERIANGEWMRRIAEVLGTTYGQLLNHDDNPVSLSDKELIVLRAMREGDAHVADTLVHVAEGLHPQHSEPSKKRSS